MNISKEEMTVENMTVENMTVEDMTVENMTVEDMTVENMTVEDMTVENMSARRHRSLLLITWASQSHFSLAMPAVIPPSAIP